MANVTGASLTPILQRLNSVSGYHPFEANTFADWAMESGDMVTVSRAGAEYTSPVHSTRMVWKGTPEMQVTSTGNKERDPVSVVSKKKYRRGSGGMRSSEAIYKAMFDENGYLRSVLEYTESRMRLEFMSADASIRSALEMTESHLRTDFGNDITSLHSYVEQTASYWHSELVDTSNSLRSYVDQTASHWHSELESTESGLRSYVDQTASGWNLSLSNTRSQLQSSISAQAGRIDLVVSGTGSNARINPAAIMMSINGDTSSIKISADKIILDGTTIAQYLEGQRIGALSFMGDQFYLNEGGTLILGEDSEIGSASSAGLIVRAETLQNGSLRLTRYDGTYLDFSKATTLSGEWSGRNYNVTATPQGNVKQGIVYDDIVPDTSEPVEYRKVGNNHYVERYHYVYSEDEEGDADTVILHKKVGILANAAYEAGYTAGSASGGSTTLSASWTGSGKITVTASPQGATLERLLQAGAVNWNGATATIPISAVYGSSGQYSDGVVFSPIVNVASKLQSITITESGTYTPDSNYIGFDEVTVNITSTDAKARFNAAAGSYYIEAYDNHSGTSIAGSSLTYQLGLVGTSVQIQNMSGNRIGSTPQYSIPLETRSVTENGTYTPTDGKVGISSIAVNVPSYDSAHVAGAWGSGNNANVWTVSKTTSGSANAVSMTITAGVSSQSYNSSTHKYTAYGYAYGNGAQKASSGGSVSGTEAYDDGWGAARGKVSVPTASSTNGSIAVKYPALAVGDQGTTNYYPSADNNYAYIRVGSATGTAVARVSHSAYSNGWSGCYGTVGLDSTTAKTLGYGESVTVYAQAKSSSSANSKTNVASRKITAPADRYNAGKSDFVNLLATASNELVWFGYTTTRGSKASFISPSWPESGYRRYLYARFDESVGGTRHNITANTWYVPEPWIFTASGEGSQHQGDLTAGSYICIGARYYNDSGSYVSTTNPKFTWKVPSGGSSPSYSVSIKGKGNNATSASGGVFTGYTTHYVSSMPSRQPQAYQYILFTVDGRKHAFYW